MRPLKMASVQGRNLLSATESAASN